MRGHRAYAISSYSQEGEDLVLQCLFDQRKHGVYVDVGAYHPYRFSNTYLFYRRGWRGINIDAMPQSMGEFHRARPRDINLELGVSLQPGTREFFVFQELASNTFDSDLARDRQASGWPLATTCRVECCPLSTILARELPRLGMDHFDFLSVDVEGRDLEVMRSNDWVRFRPEAVVVEELENGIADFRSLDIGCFPATVGYRPFVTLNHSAVLLRRD